jgi:hypothetical protein
MIYSLRGKKNARVQVFIGDAALQKLERVNVSTDPASKTRKYLDQVMEPAAEICKDVMKGFKTVMADEVCVEFGVKIGTGLNIGIVSGDASHDFKISLKWHVKKS